MYVNGRPVDLPKVNKILNEIYGSFNSLQKPMAVLNFILVPTSYDVNVTPDKRKVFLHTEGALLVALREALERVYTPDKYTFTVNSLAEDPNSTKQKGAAASQQESDEESPQEKAGAEDEDEDSEMPSSSGREGRTSFEIRSASPSTSGQEKRAKSDSLNLMSFKMKGPKTVTGTKRPSIVSTDAGVSVKKTPVSRSAPKILQSRLLNFVSTSKKSTPSERYHSPVFTLMVPILSTSSTFTTP